MVRGIGNVLVVDIRLQKMMYDIIKYVRRFCKYGHW